MQMHDSFYNNNGHTLSYEYDIGTSKNILH